MLLIALLWLVRQRLIEMDGFILSQSTKNSQFVTPKPQAYAIHLKTYSAC